MISPPSPKMTKPSKSSAAGEVEAAAVVETEAEEDPYQVAQRNNSLDAKI